MHACVFGRTGKRCARQYRERRVRLTRRQRHCQHQKRKTWFYLLFPRMRASPAIPPFLGRCCFHTLCEPAPLRTLPLPNMEVRAFLRVRFMRRVWALGPLPPKRESGFEKDMLFHFLVKGQLAAFERVLEFGEDASLAGAAFRAERGLEVAQHAFLSAFGFGAELLLESLEDGGRFLVHFSKHRTPACCRVYRNAARTLVRAPSLFQRN